MRFPSPQKSEYTQTRRFPSNDGAPLTSPGKDSLSKNNAELVAKCSTVRVRPSGFRRDSQCSAPECRWSPKACPSPFWGPRGWRALSHEPRRSLVFSLGLAPSQGGRGSAEHSLPQRGRSDDFPTHFQPGSGPAHASPPKLVYF